MHVMGNKIRAALCKTSASQYRHGLTGYAAENSPGAKNRQFNNYRKEVR